MSEYSVVVPVLHLEDNPLVEQLIARLREQTHPPVALHLVVGDRRQGRAINFGVSKVTTPYVATLDDDSFIEDPKLFEKLVKAMEQHPNIGMGGASCEIPSWASPFQKKAMEQIPRRRFPVQLKHMDSDFVQHPCLIMPTELFREIGGEDEELIRGLDPVLRKKVRDAGYRVTIIANTFVYHLLPDGWGPLFRMYQRNGRGSGYAQRHFPERVLELTDGRDRGSFVEKRPLWWRAARRCRQIFQDIFQGRWVALWVNLAYTLGVIQERCYPSSLAQAPSFLDVNSTIRAEEPFFIEVHHVKLGDPVENKGAAQ